MAVQNFADPAQHRPAAKKVLIIAASSYSYENDTEQTNLQSLPKHAIYQLFYVHAIFVLCLETFQHF